MTSRGTTTLAVADDTCLDAPIVARDDETGDQVARQDGQLCSGDIWVIYDDRTEIRH